MEPAARGAAVIDGPTDSLSDADLVRRVRGGDGNCYRVLVERYQDTLFRCARAQVREHDVAADVVQATFVHAYDRLASLRDESSFGGWVYRMCLNRCRDHLKSARRRDVPLDATPEHRLAGADRADRALEDEELRRLLDHALAALNDSQRTAFVLKHVEERTYEEMSDMLGEPVGALKMRVHRAREALKRTLEEVL
jgi:RNA polymerase sigma-70 factor, ECF subfamily